MAIIRFTIAIFLVAFLMATIFSISEAAYRKPPFNGSIFGKRNSIEYDNAKALTTLCEIAMESCQAWFPQTDNK
ncbi:neuropeptide SIFamide-like [Teleopsis dalmanni]|uniref:neuropeptide SIFamide n=1 Tax=Teleopsis dalmanni TaxID=139649 RepID=UPI000D32ADDC|nr:neuropeptide SIFamide [Teleopsis dalmanni]XP_037954776.1 neuropeptide SIFamide-like [Teleopsis dalmanni]